MYTTVNPLYQTLQSTLGYDAVIRHPRVIGCKQQLAFAIAAELLQIETWLLLTAHRNSSSPYLTLPSPSPTHATMYGLAALHMTTERQHMVPKTRLNGWPKRKGRSIVVDCPEPQKQNSVRPAMQEIQRL